MADSRSPNSSPSHETVSSLSFPLDAPATDLDEAVQKLQNCPPSELQRACVHHRRALEALHEGAYKALSDATRTQLIDRFQANLDALEKALATLDDEVDNSPQNPRASDDSSSSSGSQSHLLSALPTWIW